MAVVKIQTTTPNLEVGLTNMKGQTQLLKQKTPEKLMEATVEVNENIRAVR